MATTNTDPFLKITQQTTLKNVSYNPKKLTQNNKQPFSSTTDITSLSASDISKLTVSNIKNLTKIQQQNFGSEQAMGLTSKLLTEMPFKYVPSDSISSISTSAITGLKIEVLSKDQFSALTAEQIHSLLGKQTQLITSQQFSIISPEQSAALDSIDASTLKTLANINENSISSLTIEFIKALPPVIFSTLSPLQLTFFTTEQIHSLSSEQIKSLNVIKISKLNDEQVSALSKTAIQGLNKSNIKGLNISGLLDDQISTLTSDQVSLLTTEQVSQLSSDKISLITPSAVKGFQQNQITALSEDAITAIDPLAFSNLQIKTFSSLTEKQLKAITVDQINNITSKQLSALNSNQISQLDSDVIHNLPIKSLSGLGKENIKGLNIADLNAQQFQALTAGQIGLLNNMQINQIDENQAINLTPSTIKALSSAQVHNLSITAIPAIKTNAIVSLTTNSIKGLTAAQIQALTVDQINALRPEQIAVLDSNQIGALEKEDIASLLPASIKSISPTTIPILDVNIFTNLSSKQISALTTAQIQALTPGQIAKFTADQSIGLKSDQAEKMSSTQASNFSLDAIPALSINVIKVLNFFGFDSIQIEQLTPKQIAALTPSQLSSLSTNARQGFSADQIAALSPTNFNWLYSITGNNANVLTLNVISALDAKKLANFSTSLLESLTPEQVLKLSSESITWLTNTKGYHISNNRIFTDIVKPTLINSNVNGSTLILTYDEILNPITSSKNAFNVLVDSISNPVTSIAINDLSHTITLTLTTPVLNSQNVTISYTDISKNDDINVIQDTAGNDAISLSKQSVINNTPDITPPSFVSAEVNGRSLQMTYTDANLLNSSTASANAFIVTVNGLANSVTAVSANAASKTISLLLTNFVENGQSVTVAYTDPTTGNDSNAIQDEAGNDAVSLAAHTVTNTTKTGLVTTNFGTLPFGTLSESVAAAAGGAGVTTKIYSTGGSGGNFTINYDMYGQADQMDVYVRNILVSSTNGPVSGQGTLTIASNILSAGTQVKVTVTGTNGTQWQYQTSYSGGILEETSSVDIANDATIQPDGKIIAVGKSGLDIALARYNTDGSLDFTFGTYGKVLTDINNGDDSAQSLVFQPDGKILVAGITNHTVNGVTDPANFILIRYNKDGTLDSTFGTAGKVTDAISHIEKSGSMALQSDGKIVIAGGDGNDFCVTRYNSNGSLDITFGLNGKKIIDFSGGIDTASGVAIQADGKLVIVGTSTSNSNNNNISSNYFALARLNLDDTLDTTFSSDGKISDYFGNANDVTIQKDGKVLVVGTTYSNDFGTARYNTDGTLDASFTFSSSNLPSNINFTGADIGLQSDGTVFIGGTSNNTISSLSDFALGRYDVNGKNYYSFGQNGLLTSDFGYVEIANNLLIQTDGKILLVGGTGTGSDDFALTRYNIDGSLDTTFGN
jgi:uncharacterized delta-60 repeat protein/uncharacterized repeat protein (TIGR02059 family)